MYIEPKIIMNKTEEIKITEHSLGEYDCVLIYKKSNNENAPTLFAIMEFMPDMSYNDDLTYILVNFVNGFTRGIYPCDPYTEYWEEVFEGYFSNPNDFYYVYKHEDDYTVNEEYNFK